MAIDYIHDKLFCEMILLGNFPTFFYFEITLLPLKKKKEVQQTSRQIETHFFIYLNFVMNAVLKRIIKGKVEASCDFERLPKIVLASILCFLDFNDICSVWRLNKFFFKLLCDSNVATVVWKTLYLLVSLETEKEAEKKAKKAKGVYKDTHLNQYTLLCKHSSFTWDPNQTGRYLKLSDDLREARRVNGSWSVSKTKRSFSKGVHFAEILVSIFAQLCSPCLMTILPLNKDNRLE